MILCDIDGVLATGEGRDTAGGESIYRTFAELPEELERIRAAGIPFHVVTAKVEAEAAQILEAVGVRGYVDTVIGADRLFWPTMWNSVRRRSLPGALSKSVFRGILRADEGGRVVMIEDHADHLREMLGAGAIDIGVLVPRMVVTDGAVMRWFELELALRLARGAAAGTLDPAEAREAGVSLHRWDDGAFPEVEAGAEGPAAFSDGRFLLRLPPVSFHDSTSPPALGSLDTGTVLRAARVNVVTAARAGRRFARRMARLLSSPGRSP